MVQGIMLNEDDTHFFYTRDSFEQLGEEEIRAFIRQYEGTQVKDFLLCCMGRMAAYPSQVRQSFLDKYDQKQENGVPVDYTQYPIPRCAKRIYRDQGLDFYAICIDELRRIGIRPWLSIRMNDCHDNDLPSSFLHPDFYHEHPEYRRVTHRAPMGYFDRCFDYAVPKVRKMMLDSVREAAFRYDADGIELDWLREVYCFRIGHEWEGIEIINQFMRDVKAILRQAGEKWGHPVSLAARTLRDPQTALDMGFDTAAWAKDKLVDVLIPSPRWRTADSDLPIETWKHLLSGTNVKLAAGIELLLQPNPAEKTYIYTMPEHVNALAAQYLSAGADAVYLFNYMDSPDPARLHEDRSNPEGSSLEPEHYMRLLHTVGSLEKVVHSERRHVLTYADVGPVWNETSRLAPLPRTAKARQSCCLRLRTGEIPLDATVELRLCISGDEANIPAVFVNSEPCTYLRNEPLVPSYTKNPAFVYAVRNETPLPPFLVIEIIPAREDIVIDYAEVHCFI